MDSFVYENITVRKSAVSKVYATTKFFKLKILFLSHYFYPGVGGIETVSDILTQAFHNAGHEVHVMTWTAETGKRTFPFVIVRNPSFSQIIKEHRWADLVFENNPTMRLGWPRLLFRKKTAIALHTWIEKKPGKADPVYFFKQKYLALADKVIACSDAIRKQCWEKAVVIENPYQDSLFRRLPDVSKTKDFIFLGRLVSDKGPALAVQAFAKVVSDERLTGISLTITGEGNEKAKLQQMVTELNIERNVSFTGALQGEELVTCLNKHRFILVPSVWNEPFGLVVLEGMACGCVPVTSNSGGLLDAVGNAGIMFERGNADELAQCMMQLLSNHRMEDELRTKAPAHLTMHTVSFVSNRYLQEVEQL